MGAPNLPPMARSSIGQSKWQIAQINIDGAPFFRFVPAALPPRRGLPASPSLHVEWPAPVHVHTCIWAKPLVPSLTPTHYRRSGRTTPAAKALGSGSWGRSKDTTPLSYLYRAIETFQSTGNDRHGGLHMS